jgi:hypothetical protein
MQEGASRGNRTIHLCGVASFGSLRPPAQTVRDALTQPELGPKQGSDLTTGRT